MARESTRGTRLVWHFAGCLSLTAALSSLGAQTDWYNTDRGRPLRTEDALVAERHAFELHLAPLTITHTSGFTRWRIAPELAWGVAPRTEIEAGFALGAERQARSSTPVAVENFDIGVLHALNVESLGVPAFALSASAVIPAGGHRAEVARGEIGLFATRTTRIIRTHVNARFGVGPSRVVDTEVPRWSAGVAIDRALALRAMLIAAEVTAERRYDASDVAWHAGTGIRVQWTPRVSIDAGVGRTYAGAPTEWTATVGWAFAFAVPALQLRGAR